MIHFNNVTKSYASANALRNLELEISEGEMAFLTGHSGAGKSTLLKLIMLIERPTQGQVFVNQHNLNQLKRHQIPTLRRDIGMIFQNPMLLSKRTIFENVALPLIINGYRTPEIKRRVQAALDKVGLLDKHKLYPPALSAGEKQRIGIARAVVNKPTILLADEPTGNLDPELSKEIMNLFRAFNDVGVTILVATHDLPLVATMNHRIITLKKGQLIQ